MKIPTKNTPLYDCLIFNFEDIQIVKKIMKIFYKKNNY